MQTHSVQMSRALLAVGVVALLHSAVAQVGTSVLPATAPTHAAPTVMAQAQTGAAAATQADVQWTGTVLSIRASGQALPAILRQVARLTGMRITGGAPGEPVFGTYGPAGVQQVLASLLDGLNVNMLLVNETATKPKELILTARTGGPTAPAPSQTVAVEPEQPMANPADVNQIQPRAGRHTSPDSFQGPPNGAGTQGAGAVGPTVPLNDGSNTTGTSATNTDANGTPQSPNGVRTPEQIFEELRKRQQGARQ